MGVFRFKQFEVDQEGCAMRINTDGVLLGAMVQQNNPKQVLDIGTGTGVIALMLAQRFTEAEIIAVEKDESSAQTADSNFKNSVFSERLTSVHQDFLDFETDTRFDLIVSNPPFFINDLKNPDLRKGIARHTDLTFFEQLVLKGVKMLSENGQIALVLPLQQAELIHLLFEKEGLFRVGSVDICSFKDKDPFRRIVSYSKIEAEEQKTEFIVYDTAGVHSDQYRQVLKEFFIAF